MVNRSGTRKLFLFFRFFFFIIFAKKRCVTTFYSTNCVIVFFAPFSIACFCLVLLSRSNILMYTHYAFYFMHAVINRFVSKYKKKKKILKYKRVTILYEERQYEYNGCDVNVTNVLTETVANSQRRFHFIKSRSLIVRFVHVSNRRNSHISTLCV